MGHDKKVRGPKQWVPEGETGRGRPRWEGAEHPEEPPLLPSPGGPYCVCVRRITHAYTLRHRPTLRGAIYFPVRELVQ